MKRILQRLPAFLLIGAVLLAACAQPTPTPEKVEVTREVKVEVTRVVEVTAAPPPTTAPPAARTLTVQAGGGQETDVISAFLPALIRIRAGDTLTWKLSGDEIHTVSFNPPPEAFQPVVPVPGGGPTDFMISPQVGFPTRFPGAPVETFDGTSFASSGIMSKQPPAPGAPPNDTFSLTFDTPGTYPFLCLIHPYMTGAVVVEPVTATTVPEQKDIDAQIKAEMAPLSAQVEAAKAATKAAQSALAPDGSALWFVSAGSSVGNPSAGTYAFGPKDLTVKVGDTVIWVSGEFHTVTFDPAPPPPEFVIPKPQEGGPPLLTVNPEVLLPAKPAAVYDPAQYYNSGPMGPGSPAGTTFALTFDKPGTYEYFCAVHRELGMKGAVTVKAP